MTTVKLRFFILFIALYKCFISVATAEQIDTELKRTPPNILFILADDHRWDLLSKKSSVVQTPNLDALANDGVMFENAFVTTPICASSRISILTGLTERTHDYTFGRPATGLVESSNTYPALLKNAGYHTGFVGKYEIKMSGEDSERFDYFMPLLQAKTNEWRGKQIPQTYYIKNLASEFIKNASNTNKPWVLAVNFWNPHAHDFDQDEQFHYPPEFESMYSDIDIQKAYASDDGVFENLPAFLKSSMARIRWKYRFSTPEMYQRIVKRHYRAISSVDDAVGALNNLLKSLGLEENTIIIYTGDNGYALNERQLAGKWFGWEEDLRVPLIIKDPRKSKHKTVNELALNIDIAPTILDFAGVEIPDTYQGKSLITLIGTDESGEWRDEFFFEHMYQPKRAPIPPMYGLRTEHWKLVNFYKNDYVQLYDLERDPFEMENLAYEEKYRYLTNALLERAQTYIDKYEGARSTEVKARSSFENSPSTH
jgi:arylsulfatase A-like enzyme